MSDNEEFAFQLVVPFVVCKSAGGPFDDAAFCAGVLYGVIREGMRTWAALWRAGNMTEAVSYYVQPELVPQLDLLAMEFEVPVVTEFDEVSGHFLVQFRRPSPQQSPDNEEDR